jgi:hypothetical protein
MTATTALTTDLQRQVLILEDDLRARLATDPVREGEWKQEYQRATDKDRTAASWITWRDDRITQAAVAWILTTVFIRFCEDNALLRPVWITGPGARRQEALDAQLAFFRQHPDDTDREWLQDAVSYLSRLPATRALVEIHSALHLVSPSGDAVTHLLEFWRRRGDDGALVHDLTDPSLSTRFLGDLYQDLSQHAKDTYALLQTPVFVEEFILDRTMEPALVERPLEGFRLIDPACGSGHFLLGAFARLLNRWHRHAPDMETQTRVQTALDAIHGVDLNPFAIAIARFRLTLAALQASGLQSLEQAPAFTFHLAVGDSLIHGPDRDALPGMEARSAFMPFTYTTEDSALLLSILEEGRYDVVIGNPPYITVKDKALNQIYRSKYTDVCKGTYAMTVPFMKLMFSLAKVGERPGWIGQITSNSFMKREFGSKLIEDFLAYVDLQLVVDTSGSYIPGHGTPTVIIVGRNQSPAGPAIRAVLGIRGEPGRPDDPAKGIVWTAIIEHVDEPGWDDGWVTVTDLDRELLATHPWSLAGGGAIELREHLEKEASTKLANRIAEIGFGAVTREDSAYMVGDGTLRRYRVEMRHRLPIVEGDAVRDWAITQPMMSIWPYDPRSFNADSDPGIRILLWPYKRILSDRVAYGSTQLERGLAWFEYSMFFARRFRTPLSIAFAEVATHNHFVLDRGGKIFKQTAPVIKLNSDSTEEEHLALLGVLNSSTACFWLKQVCHNKGEGGGARVEAGYATRGEDIFRETFAFNGGNVAELPLPAAFPVTRAGELEALATKLAAQGPSEIAIRGIPAADSLAAGQANSNQLRERMISIQEELDWEVYRLYGLINEDLTYSDDNLPGLALGERAFEIALARAVRDGKQKTAWFSRHKSTPVIEIPAHWPVRYQEVVQLRLNLIASDPFIKLLEKPECKRRWMQEPWDTRQEQALREWLLNRLEERRFWFDPQGRPRPRSIAQLADEVGRNVDLTSVLAQWEGRPDVPVTQSLTRLLADETVPFLAAYRYKDSGLRKREVWEQTWALQSREDKGEHVGQVQVPPKYTSADFQKASYWHARGKLDVPKERFILYPDAGRETDPTPLLGWAGWDHAEQSLALSVIITDRENEGWPADPLVPLVAGLAELQPWVEQWHSDVDQRYGVSMATFCREQLTARAAQVGKTIAELAAWRPAAAVRGRRPRS